MPMRILLLFIFSMVAILSQAQNVSLLPDEGAKHWADSVYNRLTPNERIGQLMIVRLSSIDFKKNQITFYDEKIDSLIHLYNIGGICLFQGSPQKQASLINHFQSIAKTPILMCIDAENGLGMRILDSVIPLPRQMMLGAMNSPGLVYDYGRLVAAQCKRLGIQVNYAPVVDVNNNPDNPVINDRSFGEDPNKVAEFGIRYMQGLQDGGVMACAKHFPGHGDVSVDSHYDLPVINKSRVQLDSLELIPFKRIFAAGVGSVMIAHLYIPAIDNRPNRPTSISYNNVTKLLREDLGYQGLTFTDALDMKGVSKYFPNGEASVEALIAGNDMLCLPEDIPLAVGKINQAIEDGRLSWQEIETHCKKILAVKYQYGLEKISAVSYDNLVADLNRGITELTKQIARQSITLLSKSNEEFFPLKEVAGSRTAVVAVGTNSSNAFTEGIKKISGADVFFLNYNAKDSALAQLVQNLADYNRIVISYHNMGRSPSSNFGLSRQSITLPTLLSEKNTLVVVFGNAYAIKNFCNEKNLVLCYEDSAPIQETAVQMLEGEYPFIGTIPVTPCENFHFGSGISTLKKKSIILRDPFGFDMEMEKHIDSLVNFGIKEHAMPGCEILVAKNGKLAFQKAYGSYTYSDSSEKVSEYSVYDLASLTKIFATTLSVMKLYDQGKIDLKKELADYLPEFAGTNKAHISIEKLLLHEGGLVPYIPFYKETLSSDGLPSPIFYRNTYSDSFPIQVAKDLFLRRGWQDSILKKILESPVHKQDYLYSDNDFILLGRIVEQVSGMGLFPFAKKYFYDPLSLESTRFQPLHFFPVNRIVPTEIESGFRDQQIDGFVHDPGAALMGGIAGHAGLFSDGYDVAVLMQMLLDKGSMNGRTFFKPETVALFTRYQSTKSRRGLGFDKPEKDNSTRKDPYPAASSSPATFGHTGFTGTCAWADPEKQLVFVFLSNRVFPDNRKTLQKIQLREKLLELVYQSLPPDE